MIPFRHVLRVNVSLWGRRVGTLVTAPRQSDYAFRYDREFLDSGLEIAPLMMPLSPQPYHFPDLPRQDYYGLPPAFADSLPDSFGSALIDGWLALHGLPKDEITPLDRLAYLGRRALGALTYEPEQGPKRSDSTLELRKLVEEARDAVNGDLLAMSEEDAFLTILRLGSSAGGAQAKAVVGWNRSNGQFVYGDREIPKGFEHWIIKFTPKEYPWRGQCEYDLYRRACDAGVRMSRSELYELDGLKHFMTKRFDRADDGQRRHMLTLSALSHFPNATPPEFRSYDQLFATADALGVSYEEREQLFARMAFNVYCDECDDHSKNFAFLMDESGRWRIAPAYDLTGSAFPPEDPWSAHGDTHQLSVNGKFTHILDSDLLTVADRFAIGTAPKVLERIKLHCTSHIYSLSS